VIGRGLVDWVWPLRTSLVLRSLLRRPFGSVFAVAKYFALEIAVRILPRGFETVCFVGVDGDSKTTIIENLIPLLQSSAKFVEKRRLAPRLYFGRPGWDIAAAEDSQRLAPYGSFVSMAKVLLWLLEEWASHFTDKKNHILSVCENYYQDILIDPRSYRYGGPMWFARLVGKFIPSPILWILLDLAEEGRPPNGQEIPPAGIGTRMAVSRSFVRSRERYVILDVSKAAASATEDAYATIIDTLAQIINRRLDRRF